MAQVTRGWDGPFGDRYKFDFKLCTSAKGWAQLDTRQDASYYGNWINPLSRELVSYAEGDLTHTLCEDDADFVATVRECCRWHKAAGYFLGIDPGLNPAIEAAFRRLGLAEFLHGGAETENV